LNFADCNGFKGAVRNYARPCHYVWRMVGKREECPVPSQSVEDGLRVVLVSKLRHPAVCDVPRKVGKVGRLPRLCPGRRRVAPDHLSTALHENASLEVRVAAS
jgi:hypothetical protein